MMSNEMKDTLRDMAKHPFRTFGEFVALFGMCFVGFLALIAFGQGYKNEEWWWQKVRKRDHFLCAWACQIESKNLNTQ